MACPLAYFQTILISYPLYIKQTSCRRYSNLFTKGSSLWFFFSGFSNFLNCLYKPNDPLTLSKLIALFNHSQLFNNKISCHYSAFLITKWQNVKHCIIKWYKSTQENGIGSPHRGFNLAEEVFWTLYLRQGLLFHSSRRNKLIRGLHIRQKFFGDSITWNKTI